MPKPILQALVLADNVYQDKITGKKIIAGTFNRILYKKAKEKPADGSQNAELPAEGQHVMQWHEIHRTGSPHAYISLTEVRGQVSLELRYVDLADYSILISTKFNVECNNPSDTVEAIIPVPSLPTPHAGVYALELLSNDEPLGALRITALELTTPEKPE